MTRNGIADQQAEAQKTKDWLNETIKKERLNVNKEKQNVERLNSRIGQLELVGPDRCCSPCHQHAVKPSFHESNGML